MPVMRTSAPCFWNCSLVKLTNPPRRIFPPMFVQSFFAQMPSSSPVNENLSSSLSNRYLAAARNMSHDAPLFVESLRM